MEINCIEILTFILLFIVIYQGWQIKQLILKGGQGGEIPDEAGARIDAINALETENQALRDQIAEGFTNEQLQAHADRVDAIIAGVKEIVPNLPEPEPTE